MINHKHKFIYTKVGKSASSSVTRALRNIEGKKSHCDHYHILDDINQQTQDYFKFTFVRNPWARLVSRYFYIRQKQMAKCCVNFLEGNSTFAEFAKSKGPSYGPDDERKFYYGKSLEVEVDVSVKHPCYELHQWHRKVRLHCPHLAKLYIQKAPFENQLDWISDQDGNVLVDFIGRFENLQGDFNAICDKIGIRRQELPHHNKSKHKHYTEYYDDESKQAVAEKFARDIEYFGYEFGE